MTERPILFSGPMVCALLDGRKTQTRRIVKREPLRWLDDSGFDPAFVADPANGLCPYGKQGDTLWVRESHQRFDKGTCDQHVWYMAGRNGNAYVARERPEIDQDRPWPRDAEGPSGGAVYSVPSIHMPRWASRLSLEITDVRIERLQDISDADAEAEGIREPGLGEMVWAGFMGVPRDHCAAKTAFALLWMSIHGADSWTASPWVWAVSFKVGRP